VRSGDLEPTERSIITRSQQTFEQGCHPDEKQNPAGDEEQPIELRVCDAPPAASAERRRFQIPAAAMFASDHWFDPLFSVHEFSRRDATHSLCGAVQAASAWLPCINAVAQVVACAVLGDFAEEIQSSRECVRITMRHSTGTSFCSKAAPIDVCNLRSKCSVATSSASNACDK
jgi:hypothetical protein